MMLGGNGLTTSYPIQGYGNSIDVGFSALATTRRRASDDGYVVVRDFATVICSRLVFHLCSPPEKLCARRTLRSRLMRAKMSLSLFRFSLTPRAKSKRSSSGGQVTRLRRFSDTWHAPIKTDTSDHYRARFRSFEGSPVQPIPRQRHGRFK